MENSEFKDLLKLIEHYLQAELNLNQPKFVLTVFMESAENPGYTTAETAGNISYENYKSFLSYVNTHAPDAHKEIKTTIN